jgi:hypothetical protein
VTAARFTIERSGAVAAPPADVSAEQAVLCALMLKAEPPVGLESGMFHAERHRLIYRAALAVRARREDVDPITLRAELGADLERIGGLEYLATLVDQVPTGDHIGAHARIIREHAARRDLAAAVERIVEGNGALDAAERAIAALRGGVGASRYHIYGVPELLGLPAIPWRIVGLIPDNSLVGLFGPSGCGKTFLTLQWNLCIGTGLAWIGREARQGAAVYVAAEGGSGIGQRLRAACAAHAIADAGQMYVVREPVNLLDEADVRDLLASLDVAGVQPAMLTFDTFARSLVGGDENSAQDVGTAIAHADLIRRETSATVVVVHHSGWNTDRERGSSALRGALDALFSLKDQDGALTLTCEKMKDAPAPEPVRLKLVPFEGSCIIEPHEGAAAGSTLTPNERHALKALSEVEMADGASDKEWRENSQLPNGSYYRARKRLVDAGLVTPNGRPKRYALSGKGLSLALPTPTNSQ